MTRFESGEEVEILILGTILLVIGGIAGAAGLTAIATGGLSLGLIGLIMFVLGAVWLFKGFKRYQWDDLKMTVRVIMELAKEDAEAKYGKR